MLVSGEGGPAVCAEHHCELKMGEKMRSKTDCRGLREEDGDRNQIGQLQ
jgi:hypothetical protein